MADNIRKCRQKLNLENTKGSRIWHVGSSPAGPAGAHADLAAATVGASVELNLCRPAPSPTQSVYVE